MIKVSGLSFSYGSKEVLHDISFEAVPGELLCVLGHNGAGKTTLFRCMLGLLKAGSGSVLIDGTDIESMKPAERARSVAYIPQAARPVFAYSVIDMVLMGMTPRLDKGRVNPGPEEKKTALSVLEQMGVTDLAERDYTKLSGGEQQLVLIARALAQGAKTLIMDEPTSSLDYGNQMKVQKRLSELASEGYTIVQSSHNPEQAYVFADRVVCIKDGEIFREGKPRDIMDEQLIKDLYSIDVEMISGGGDRARFFLIRE